MLAADASDRRVRRRRFLLAPGQILLLAHGQILLLFLALLLLSSSPSVSVSAQSNPFTLPPLDCSRINIAFCCTSRIRLLCKTECTGVQCHPAFYHQLFSTDASDGLVFSSGGGARDGNTHMPGAQPTDIAWSFANGRFKEEEQQPAPPLIVLVPTSAVGGGGVEASSSLSVAGPSLPRHLMPQPPPPVAPQPPLPPMVPPQPPVPPLVPPPSPFVPVLVSAGATAAPPPFAPQGPPMAPLGPLEGPLAEVVAPTPPSLPPPAPSIAIPPFSPQTTEEPLNLQPLSLLPASSIQEAALSSQEPAASPLPATTTTKSPYFAGSAASASSSPPFGVGASDSGAAAAAPVSALFPTLVPDISQAASQAAGMQKPFPTSAGHRLATSTPDPRIIRPPAELVILGEYDAADDESVDAPLATVYPPKNGTADPSIDRNTVSLGVVETKEATSAASATPRTTIANGNDERVRSRRRFFSGYRNRASSAGDSRRDPVAFSNDVRRAQPSTSHFRSYSSLLKGTGRRLLRSKIIPKNREVKDRRFVTEPPPTSYRNPPPLPLPALPYRTDKKVAPLRTTSRRNDAEVNMIRDYGRPKSSTFSPREAAEIEAFFNDDDTDSSSSASSAESSTQFSIVHSGTSHMARGEKYSSYESPESNSGATVFSERESEDVSQENDVINDDEKSLVDDLALELGEIKEAASARLTLISPPSLMSPKHDVIARSGKTAPFFRDDIVFTPRVHFGAGASSAEKAAAAAVGAIGLKRLGVASPGNGFSPANGISPGNGFSPGIGFSPANGFSPLNGASPINDASPSIHGASLIRQPFGAAERTENDGEKSQQEVRRANLQKLIEEWRETRRKVKEALRIRPAWHASIIPHSSQAVGIGPRQPGAERRVKLFAVDGSSAGHEEGVPAASIDPGAATLDKPGGMHHRGGMPPFSLSIRPRIVESHTGGSGLTDSAAFIPPLPRQEGGGGQQGGTSSSTMSPGGGRPPLQSILPPLTPIMPLRFEQGAGGGRGNLLAAGGGGNHLQCGAAPDFVPCMSAGRASERLLICCKSKALPQGCLDLCRYDITQQEVRAAMDAGRCGLLNVQPYLECASAGVDNTECCRHRGIAQKSGPQCEDLCRPTGGFSPLGLQHIVCGSVMQDLMRCHHSGVRE